MAKRPVWITVLGFFVCGAAIAALVGIFIYKLAVGTLFEWNRARNGVIFFAGLVMTLVLGPNAFGNFIRAIRTLNSCGSAAIWLADGQLHSIVSSPIPVGEVAGLAIERTNGIRFIHAELKSGRRRRISVGGITPGVRETAATLRRELGLPPLS